VNNTL